MSFLNLHTFYISYLLQCTLCVLAMVNGQALDTLLLHAVLSWNAKFGMKVNNTEANKSSNVSKFSYSLHLCRANQYKSSEKGKACQHYRTATDPEAVPCVRFNAMEFPNVIFLEWKTGSSFYTQGAICNSEYLQMKKNQQKYHLIFMYKQVIFFREVKRQGIYQCLQSIKHVTSAFVMGTEPFILVREVQYSDFER